MAAGRSTRLMVMAALMVGAATVVLVVGDLPPIDTKYLIPWWLLAAGFGVSELLSIHIPTKRSLHSMAVTEIPFVVGLAFSSLPVFVAAYVIGAIPVYAYRRQSPSKLLFNSSLAFLEASTSATVYRLILGGAQPVEPRGWLAAMAAVVVSGLLGALLVAVAIAVYDADASLRRRSREVAITLLISIAAGLIGIVWVLAIWTDPRSTVLLVLSAVPIFLALRVFERLGRRHDELGAAYELTTTLEECETSQGVVDLALQRIAAVLVPEAAIVLVSGEEPTGFHADDVQVLDVDPSWEAQLANHRVACAGEEGCTCARRIMGDEWAAANSYVITIGGEQAGMLIVRPRAGVGHGTTPSDDQLMKAIAAQLSSALTRIEAIGRLQAEVVEKQELIRSKDRLIASVSHELRTPLTGIMGFSELLSSERTEINSVDLEFAKRAIAIEARDLSNIVEDLTTAARADLDSLEVQALPVSTYEALTRATSHLRSDRRIPIVGPDLTISADGPRVRQILRNLLTNAERYGGDRIEARVARRDQVVDIYITDDGQGVPADREAFMFEPYESAHEEPSQPGSLGLGLTISRTLARLMQGDLTYRRRDGLTEFRLTLPAAPDPAVSPAPIEARD